MSRIIADMVAFGKQYIRSGVAMFFAFAFPILLILIFGAIFSGSGDVKFSMPIQDLDDGPYSDIYVDILRNITVVEVKMIPSDEDFYQYFEDNDLNTAILIPSNFSEQIALALAGDHGAKGLVTVYGDPSTSSFTTLVEIVEFSLTDLGNALTASTPVVGYLPRVPEELGGLTFMDFFLPGVVGLVVMTNTLYTITSTCAEYKTRSYFKLLATTRLKKHEWLLSKFLFYTVLLIASLLLTFAVGMALFDMTATITPLAVVFIAFGVFLFLSMGMLLGSIVRDPESASAVANAVGFPMMFLSGIFFELESMPGYIQAISKVFPLTYFNDGLRATMLEGDVEVALVNLAIVGVLGLVFFILGSKLMSWKER
ncbi:MAG: ABC transporter permease [Candidatus Thermoplasmatota archaeon]|nr:ABC transporter permease [Candidatus Thermoplasmatota archaeon]